MSTAPDSAHSTLRAEAGFEHDSSLSIQHSGHRRSDAPTEGQSVPKHRRGKRQPSPRLMSIRDAAAYLACSEWVMRSLIDKGELPHLNVGKKLRVDRGDLDTFIDSHRTTNPSGRDHRVLSPKLVSKGK